MEIIDLPLEVMRCMKVTWKMEMNNNFVQSPFSGVGQTQRGQLERWNVDFEFHNLRRIDSPVLEGFFLQLEGNANVFRTGDPSKMCNFGRAKGSASLDGVHSAGSKFLNLTGLKEDVLNAFRAGDWVQIGNQMTKVKKDAHTDSAGGCAIEIFPKLWQEHSSGTELIYKNVKGIFRFLSETPEWEVTAGVARAYSYKLSGTQEVITDGHELAT